MAKLGEKIPVKPEIKDALKVITERRKDAEAAFTQGASMLRSANESLWELLNEAHPELLRDHHVTYSHTNQEMTVIGTRRAGDE